MEQNTEDWLSWRRKGLGSSDAPIVMKESPWGTPFTLWQDKTHREIKDQSNWATRRGHDLEPIARSVYEFEVDQEMEPCLLVHPQIDWIRCSYDGVNEDGTKALEIKCPGKEDHATAVAGKIPTKYQWQICHQFLAKPEIETIDYFSFDGQNGVIVTVERDLALVYRLFNAEEAFWALVKSDTAPDLTDGDYQTFKRGTEFQLFKKLELDMIKYKDLGEKIKKQKSLIISNVKHSRVKASGLTMYPKSGKIGAIDYKVIPEVMKLEEDYLNGFRGDQSEDIVTFTLDKKGKENGKAKK